MSQIDQNPGEFDDDAAQLPAQDIPAQPADLESRSWFEFEALIELAPPKPRPGDPAAAGDPAANGHPAGANGEMPAAKVDTFNEQRVVEAIQLDVLGKTGYGKVKVFSRYHRTVETIGGVSRMKFEDLLEVAGPPARMHVAETGGEDMPVGMHSLKDVRRAISMLAGFHKIDDETELGPGCWRGKDESGTEHPSVVLVGNREAAYWNGSQTLQRVDHPRCLGRLLDFDSACKPWYDFKQLSEYLSAAKEKKFREQAMNDCINLFSHWRWKNEASSPIVLAGLIFATWVQTLWEWRPLVTVIGKTSSGKSMFFKALSGIFGGLCETCSDSTEAGIRQIIENSARVILFDEFDAEDKRQFETQQRILKMLRASGRGDSIFRGSSDQKGKKFNLQHIVWLAGIQISSPREANRNRYMTLESLPPKSELRGKLQIPPLPELAELGQRMLATAIFCIQDARKVAVNLKDTRIEGVDDRVVESYAVPAAILAAIQGDGQEAAGGLLREMLAEIATEDHGGQSDEQTLMADILGAQIQIGGNRFSVAQLLEIVIRQQSNWHDAETALESRGIRLDEFTETAPANIRGTPCILIAYHLITEYLIKNTKWGSQAIDQILKRLPSAIQSRRRVGGQRVQTVALSLAMMKSEFLGLADLLEAKGF